VDKPVQSRLWYQNYAIVELPQRIDRATIPPLLDKTEVVAIIRVGLYLFPSLLPVSP